MKRHGADSEDAEADHERCGNDEPEQDVDAEVAELPLPEAQIGAGAMRLPQQDDAQPDDAHDDADDLRQEQREQPAALDGRREQPARIVGRAHHQVRAAFARCRRRQARASVAGPASKRATDRLSTVNGAVAKTHPI